MTTKPTAPRGLKAAGRRFWQSVAGDYELRPDELRVLEHACRTIDLVEAMHEQLAAAPLMVEGSMGQSRPHPLLTEIRGHRLLLAQLLRQLKLPDEAEPTPSRRGLAAARQRWSHGA